MKRIMLAAVAAFAVTAAAQADPFAATYGNTVTEVLPNGTKLIIYLNEDKTWEQHIADKVMKGTYAWKDDTHACFTMTDPPPPDPTKASNCIEVKDTHKVGDTWTETTPKGDKITVSITAGR